MLPNFNRNFLYKIYFDNKMILGKNNIEGKVRGWTYQVGIFNTSIPAWRYNQFTYELYLSNTYILKPIPLLTSSDNNKPHVTFNYNYKHFSIFQ